MERTTLGSMLLVITALAAVGCKGLPEFDGPMCDKTATADWEPATSRPELDHIDFVTWTQDPSVEEALRSYGLNDSWEFLSGNDIDEDGIVVSPYGKTLNAIALIVESPELDPWGETLAQGFPIHGSCGEKGPGVVAYTWWGSAGERTDLFAPFYTRNVVSRAGFLIHEVGHALGLPNHTDDKDASWDDYGPYRLQLEFLAAVYHTEGLTEEHRAAAAAEFRWINDSKFVEPTGLSIEDLRPE